MLISLIGHRHGEGRPGIGTLPAATRCRAARLIHAHVGISAANADQAANDYWTLVGERCLSWTAVKRGGQNRAT